MYLRPKSVTRQPYRFSFTAASLRYADSMRLAEYVRTHRLEGQLDQLDPKAIIQRGNERTNARVLRELTQRYRQLTPTQQQLLLELPTMAQKQLLFFAICKTYRFIADFTLQTVRDKFELLDYQLTETDFYGFRNRQLLQHPELETFADSTQRKAQQVLWLMLEEGGWINNARDRTLQRQYVDPRLLEVTAADHPDWLRIYLLPTAELAPFYARHATD